MAGLDHIEELLDQMFQTFPEFLVALVADKEGFLLTAKYRSPFSEDFVFRLGACVSKIYGELLNLPCDKGICSADRVLVRCGDRSLVIAKVKDATVFGLLVPSESNLGMVMMEARRYAEQLADML